MGKGRGSFHVDVAPFRPGAVICEFSGVDESAARKIYVAVSKKLPVRTVFVRGSGIS